MTDTTTATDTLLDAAAGDTAAPDATATTTADTAAPDTAKPDTSAPTPAPMPAVTPAPAPATRDDDPPVTAKKPDKPAKAKTDVLDEPDADTRPQADWPDDWREKLAGEDTKLLGTLKRYTSPKTFAEAFFALRQKMSSGEYKKALPEDASEEQVAAWRKENGIPTKPEEYDLTLPDGIVIGEQDKPLVGKYLEAMHGVNAPPEAVKAALAVHYRLVQEQMQQQEEQEEQFKQESTDALRTEWGNDFRRNVNLVKALLETAPESARLKIQGGRSPDGRLLGNDPDVLRFLASLAREVNPVAAVVPGAGANAVAAIADEIAGYEKRMRDDRVNWFKDTKSQERYQELLTAQNRMKARAG